MRVIRQTSERRPAFTLIELVVVIAIILALAALLLSAVFKAVGLGDELKNANDIRQLDLAVQAFLTKYNVPYIPSQFVLCESIDGYFTANPTPKTDLLHQDSFQYLQRLFPRLVKTDTSSPPKFIWASGASIDWNGDGNPDGPGDKILQGQECLVFFLGGIPDASGGLGAFRCRGFSTDSTNPANFLTAQMNPPFYDFKSERLAVGQSGTGNFFHYLDAYGSLNSTKSRPYAYFSSYKSANNYLRISSSGAPAFINDCLALNVVPYGSGSNFQNPNTFQIISAGKDQVFGSSGATWRAAIASDIYPPGIAGGGGADDQANFYQRPLGVPTP
jgi:prepilin-type N-terminal cleavage/methylation domain-containing protein